MRPVHLVAYLPAGLVVLAVAALADTARNDFFQFWFAGHLVATGRSPYDQAMWASAHEAFGTLADAVRLNCPRPDAPACLWTYPPWTAWLLAPFGALPPAPGLNAEKAAFTILLAFGVLAVVRAAGIAQHWAAGTVAAGAVAAAPIVRDLVTGHFEGAFLLGLVLVAPAIRRSDPLMLGAAGLLLGTKPHLFIGLAAILVVALVARRRFRLVVWTAAVLGSVVALSLIVEPRYLTAVMLAPAKAGLSASSTWGFADQAFGSVLPGTIIVVATAGAAIAFVGRTRGDRLWPLLAAAAAVSVAVSPYVQSYDHVLLLPCLALGAARAMRRGWALAALLVVAFIAVSWWAYALELSGSSVAFAALLPALTLTAAAAMSGARTTALRSPVA